MAGLTDEAGGMKTSGGEAIERAHQAWEESMRLQLDALRVEVQAKHPGRLAATCGGSLADHSYTPAPPKTVGAKNTIAGLQIRLSYWGEEVVISCDDWRARKLADGSECSVYDTGMLLYYLRQADGAPMADQWISYRELPGGNFYSQAFQGYSGDRLVKVFGERPDDYMVTAEALGGVCLTGLPGLAYAYQPLPRIRLASILYPGDEEFAARASVLFDAAASHYMTTDGLALLGAGLVGRLVNYLKKDNHKG